MWTQIRECINKALIEKIIFVDHSFFHKKNKRTKVDCSWRLRSARRIRVCERLLFLNISLTGSAELDGIKA